MSSHEEFLELCAASTAGELSAEEQARLDTHLAVCQECRLAKSEYEAAAAKATAALAEDRAETNPELAPMVPGPLKRRRQRFSNDWTKNKMAVA